MSNYLQLETDFVYRTLELINQYEELKEFYPFDRQYNHTLLMNCLLGLIVLPKEKALTYIPQTKIVFVKQLSDWGIKKTTFHPEIIDTRELFYRLRNAVAHFDIEFISDTPENFIDRIEFKDIEAGITVATFYAEEFLPFIRYYATTLLENLQAYK
jgi:hypothetical protein